MLSRFKPAIPAAFYRTVSGTEPVREWLKELDAEDRRIVGKRLIVMFEDLPRSAA